MSVCFSPINLKNLSNRQKIKYRYVPRTYIFCDISKDKVYDIIKYSFTNSDDLSVFGYSTLSNEFWAKKFNKSEFILHFTLCIESFDHNKSNIVISTLVGTDNEIKNLIIDLREMLDMYQSSNFIKSCVDNFQAY